MELLPCPFCGSSDFKENSMTFGLTRWEFITCKKCKCRLQHIDKKFLYEQWNTRDYMFGELKIIDENKYLPWISVKDKYPEEGTNVLTLSDGNIQIGFLYYDDGDPIDSSGLIFRDHQDNNDIDFVTHWMHLPSLPEEK